jgi:hypothetical protein
MYPAKIQPTPREERITKICFQLQAGFFFSLLFNPQGESEMLL